MKQVPGVVKIFFVLFQNKIWRWLLAAPGAEKPSLNQEQHLGKVQLPSTCRQSGSVARARVWDYKVLHMRRQFYKRVTNSERESRITVGGDVLEAVSAPPHSLDGAVPSLGDERVREDS